MGKSVARSVYVGEGGGEIGERKIVAGKKGEYLTDTNQLTSIIRAGIPRQLLFIPKIHDM